MVISDDAQQRNPALALAEQAGARSDVPGAAVLVRDGQVLAESGSRVVADSIRQILPKSRALRAAVRATGDAMLEGAMLYVTPESCLMGCGALLNARVQRLMFGIREPRTGAAITCFETLVLAARHPRRVAIDEGLLAERDAAPLARFFDERR